MAGKEAEDALRRLLEEASRVPVAQGGNPFKELADARATRETAFAEALRRQADVDRLEAPKIAERLKVLAEQEAERRRELERQQHDLSEGFMDQSIFPYALEEMQRRLPNADTGWWGLSRIFFLPSEQSSSSSWRALTWSRSASLLEILRARAMGVPYTHEVNSNRRGSEIRAHSRISVQAIPTGDIYLTGSETLFLPRSSWQNNPDVQVEYLGRTVKHPLVRLEKVYFTSPEHRTGQYA